MGMVNNGLGVGSEYVEASAANNYVSGTNSRGSLEARLETTFNTPFIEKASDFIMAVERMEVSLNAIPFLDQRDGVPQEFVKIRSRRVGEQNLIYQVYLPGSAFSLTHLLSMLSEEMDYVDPSDGSEMTIIFTLSKEGFVVMHTGDKSFNDIQVEFSRRLNMILGIATADQLVFANPADYQYECASTYPRIDIGDDLQHIVIQSNLPVYTDAIGNERMPILTDFAYPVDMSSSLAYEQDYLVKSGWSIVPRDRLIYIPTEKRYLELNGDFPINNIQISGYYTTPDGDNKPIPLAFGGIFSIKLGFYLRQ